MTFNQETPEYATDWAEMVNKFSSASALDSKTSSLVYIGILAALGVENGIPFHIFKAEILSAALMALPPAGHKVTQILPSIVEVFDNLDSTN